MRKFLPGFGITVAATAIWKIGGTKAVEAIEDWLFAKMASQLGFTSPSVSAVIAFIVMWWPALIVPLLLYVYHKAQPLLDSRAKPEKRHVEVPPAPVVISLDDAFRYIAVESAWAREWKGREGTFPIYVGQQIQNALSTGKLSANGYYFHVLHGGVREPPIHTLKPIQRETWETAKIEPYWPLNGLTRRIASAPVTSFAMTGEHEGFHNIELSRADITRLWPSR